METQSSPQFCPECGNAITPDAAQGLCPHCLLAGAAQPTQPTASPLSQTTLEQVAAAFPQFEVLELIGQGGMGAVFKVRQPKLDRFAALKLLPQSLAADAAFAARFQREAQLLARLSHPNIVSVYDYGQAGEFFYLLMEYVDGVNLRQAMRASRFEPSQALGIVPKICDALQYAHDEGVLHRDIKPENILLDTKGRVKLVDFGIAKLIAQADPPPASATSGNPAYTQPGIALGTPNYMAPEQRDHPSDVDHRADIYSLGIVFYELLTGELPSGAFIRPSEKSAADPRVDAIVQQALQKNRDQRQTSAGQVRTQVQTISDHTPTSTNKPPPDHSNPHPPALANIAAAFWGMSGIIAVIAWFRMPQPPQITVWAILIAAILGLGFAIPVRKSPLGKRALIGSSINIAVWLIIAAFSAFIVPSPAVASTSADFHSRVFEADAALVDKLIPASQRTTARNLDTEAEFKRGNATGTRSAGNFSVPTTGAALTIAQSAPLNTATLDALLNAVSKPPGLLVDQTRNVSSDWWHPGLADSWTYSRADPTWSGGGGGNIFLGFRRQGSQDQIHIDARINHNIDTTSPNAGADVDSTPFYEGNSPTTGKLAFLIPFFRKDNTAHYLVIIYEIVGGKNSQ